MPKLEKHRGSRGFTMLEIVLVLAIGLIIAAMALLGLRSAQRGYRAPGDARALANQLQVAKMKAASSFTRVRLNADLVNGTYQLETLDRATNNWNADGAALLLTQGVTYSFGAAPRVPPALPPAAPLAQNEPIIFNTRGMPVDNNGNPVGTYALYVTDDERHTFAVTITASGQVQVWRLDTTGNWSLY